MNLPKACIFDLDGVIVDTVPAHFTAWKAMADELGIPFNEEDNEQLKGVSRTSSMKRILALGQREMVDEDILSYTDRKNDIYVKIISKMTPKDILPGVVDFLALLKKHGVLLALGTSSKNGPTILKAVGLEHTFDVAIDGTHVSHSKPDPEVFLLGAKALKVNPADCVVFEDAISGVEAALAGGMKCIGVGQPDILYQAHAVIPDMKNLDLTIFEKL